MFAIATFCSVARLVPQGSFHHLRIAAASGGRLRQYASWARWGGLRPAWGQVPARYGLPAFWVAGPLEKWTV